jgi:hypothetical protein
VSWYTVGCLPAYESIYFIDGTMNERIEMKRVQPPHPSNLP